MQDLFLFFAGLLFEFSLIDHDCLCAHIFDHLYKDVSFEDCLFLHFEVLDHEKDCGQKEV